MVDRASELAFYEQLYADPDAGYGYPGERPGIALDFAEKALGESASVLDVSAGRGQFAQLVYARHPDLTVHVTETVEDLLVKDLAGFPRFRWVLPGPCPVEGRWDLVVCLDVLEHLVPEDTRGAVRALAAASSRWLLLSIALFPCPWSGRETHINLRDAGQWLELLLGQLVPGWSFARLTERNQVYWVLARRDG